MANDFMFAEEENGEQNEPEEPEEPEVVDDRSPKLVAPTKPPKPVFKRRYQQRKRPQTEAFELLEKFDNLLPANAENALKAENGEITGIFAARNAQEFEDFLKTFSDWEDLTLVAVEKGRLQKFAADTKML